MIIEQSSPQDDAVARWEAKMISSTVNGLFSIMRPRFRNFPNDYIVIDVETTGLKFYKGPPQPFFPDSDLITQLGWCRVVDSKAIQQGSFILDWTNVAEIDQQALKERLAFTKQMVENKNGQPTGKHYHMTYEMMHEKGIDPIKALEMFKKLSVDDIRANGMFFVAHNGYHFDIRMLENHYNYWLKQRINFGPSEVFDTGMVEKAAQSNSTLWYGDTVKDWSYRTYKARLKDVKWSLDRACVARYKLADRHYLPLDLEGNLNEAHAADFDCYLCHLLFETYKEIAAGRRPEPPILYRSLQ